MSKAVVNKYQPSMTEWFAAIIARELKKPCIVNTKNATKALKGEDEVVINANNGTVRILERKAS